LRPRLPFAAAGALGMLLAGCLLRRAGDGQASAPATQCELCHNTVREALLKTKHGAIGHTCATCHGRSAKHSWSEDGHVPPDRPLKTRAEADALCKSCHKKAEHTATLDLNRKCAACHNPHPIVRPKP